MRLEDPYKTLGVPSDASQKDIRRAYRDLAKKHHPDLNPGNRAAEERFKSVSAANELLSDPEKRGQFDRGEIDAAGHEQARHPSYRDFAEADIGRRYGQSGARAQQWNADDLDDMFSSMFNRDPGPGGKSRRHGRDQLYVLTAAFLEAVNGATRRLTLPDGRTLDVKIPPGTTEGQVLRLRGQGDAGANGGSDGDVLIEISVGPHPFFRRDGQDVRLELPVTLSEAVLGGGVEVPTPGGPVRMRIPAHSDSGHELRLRGRGVPAHGKQGAGDLYATLRVVLGGADAALDEFLRNWQPGNLVNPRQAMETSR
jgi:DnaJ-class molecular chaperone